MAQQDFHVRYGVVLDKQEARDHRLVNADPKSRNPTWEDHDFELCNSRSRKNRSVQNKMAQRAYRKRCAKYIKELEDKVAKMTSIRPSQKTFTKQLAAQKTKDRSNSASSDGGSSTISLADFVCEADLKNQETINMLEARIKQLETENSCISERLRRDQYQMNTTQKPHPLTQAFYFSPGPGGIPRMAQYDPPRYTPYSWHQQHFVTSPLHTSLTSSVSTTVQSGESKPLPNIQIK